MTKRLNPNTVAKIFETSLWTRSANSVAVQLVAAEKKFQINLLESLCVYPFALAP